MQLSSGNRAQVTLKSERTTYNLSGTWEKIGRDYYQLALDGTEGSSGNAQVRFEGETIKGFVFRGRMNGGATTLRF